MYFPESDTYYLWDRDSMSAVAALINIGTDYDAKALVRVTPGGLPNAMTALGLKAVEEAASSSSPIGEWENEVFDFDPDGKVEFQGASPYRGPLMNSFDMDRLGTA